jgi:hypothetical protein
VPDAGLAKALSDFQGKGYAIPRLRTVTVQTKTGGSYTFDYAPHELIVAAIRQPLADCGLAVSQILAMTPDGAPALRTVLLHASGERIEDTFPLPLKEGMSAQEIGSAITYIRRYALSAILGLATEDDDDGNRASGNTVNERRDKTPQPSTSIERSLIGIVEVGKTNDTDYEYRPDPEGVAQVGFVLVEGRTRQKVHAAGEIAEDLMVAKADLLGQRATCWGHLRPETFTPSGATKPVTYYVLDLERLTSGALVIPTPTEAATAPLFDDAEIDAIMDKVPTPASPA